MLPWTLTTHLLSLRVHPKEEVAAGEVHPVVWLGFVGVLGETLELSEGPLVVS